MSYAKRKLDFRIELGTGTYGDGPANVVTLTGLRAAATMATAALPGSDLATARIYGMPLDLMNQLSSLGKPQIYTRDNVITITAGDEEAGMSVVHRGVMQDAWIDFGGVPEVSFNVFSQTTGLALMKPILPSSFQGSADVATIMAGLAEQLGLAFENNGVVSKLSNPYFPGTGGQQVIACAKAAGINATIDGVKHTLAIWPKSGNRGGVVPLISPDTGMVGYPTYSASGMTLKTLYNPNIRLAAEVQVKSSVKAASAVWITNAVAHDLSAELPGGPWFTDLSAYKFGNPTTLPS